ncbi:hypothetical protein SteCoe_5505 [Stentor coeruleus]|uniref:Uncharacterized protein n=1 Tax=Stentor coeruleus TaxID=5963 RepID=A0A1R2CS88_9CILI|nr:hypothetical protein SteCoe_5505 [Stentor coeruleus]
MIVHNQEYSARYLKRLKRIIISHLQIHKKAENTIESPPPNNRYASSIKATYIKPYRLSSLPPVLSLQTKLKMRYYPKSVTPAPKGFLLPKNKPKPGDIGTIHGFSKHFSIRKRSISQESKKLYSVSEKNKVGAFDDSRNHTEEDIEISPMTIRVKLKKHGI